MAESSDTTGDVTTTQRATWPPYSGDDTTCSKCGFDSVDTKFVNVLCIEIGNGAHMTDRFPVGGTPHPEWEHLHRQCRRCGWSWDEAVAA